MSAVDQPAPNLDIAEWVQGPSSNIDQERGNVILIEVFQVNCPGCFLGGIPESIQTYLTFKGQPLKVWGMATAFEDYGLNNLENLRKLLDTGEVVGQTLKYMMEQNQLSMGRLQYFIPFPVAWDNVVKRSRKTTDEEVMNFVRRDFADFDVLTQPTQESIKQQVRSYLDQKEFDARTFDQYGFRGTPSTLIIDKKGILRHKLFGSGLNLESLVEPLLKE